MKFAGRITGDRSHGARRWKRRGFTLIEIMVVMVILALLATLVVPKVLGELDKARVSKAKTDIRGYETALNMFRLDNFKYPSTDMGLEALIKKPTDPSIRNWKEGGYVPKLTKDPWKSDYQYISPGTRGGDFDLFSYGADGQPGGEGNDADIGNWNID
jgi:general secretion pathway protein G